MANSTLLPITNIYDVNDIKSMKLDTNLKELLIRLVINSNQQNVSINAKDTGIYDVLEMVTGNTYPMTSTGKSPRASYRRFYDWGKAFPISGEDYIAHGMINVAGF